MDFRKSCTVHRGRDPQELGPALGVKTEDCRDVIWGEEGRKRRLEPELVKHRREGRVRRQEEWRWRRLH